MNLEEEQTNAPTALKNTRPWQWNAPDLKPSKREEDGRNRKTKDDILRHYQDPNKRPSSYQNFLPSSTPNI